MKNKYAKSGMHFDAPPSVFKNAMHLRESMTLAEGKMWMFLKSYASGYKFRRQHPIGGYVLDFYCHKLKISIEIDGDYHLDEEQVAKDIYRTAYLKDLGINEIRFINNDVLFHWEKVTNDLNSILEI